MPTAGIARRLMLPALIVRTFRESVKDASHPDNDILVGTGAVYPDVRIPRSGTFGFVVSPAASAHVLLVSVHSFHQSIAYGKPSCRTGYGLCTIRVKGMRSCYWFDPRPINSVPQPYFMYDMASRPGVPDITRRHLRRRVQGWVSNAIKPRTLR